ncbi:ATP-dependent helicase [Desulfopila sp. IMCC35006]|uniref:ATP-dependent helicase n=1 Tax=Desulfopila sp. IMCC35006 TaxID=2569542 RepID=UPI0010AD99C8|nr:ATP-dependent helicase [Desulfopila sp. IMCC35006]TKB25332.1 ATP-dependent helicase [Desulfopila sp. IMCC35006]
MKNDTFSPTSEAVSAVVNRQELNESQYLAVTTTAGPVLVIAGAGSGKTRTLVYRVAHLVESGVPPEAILLLTFTRKASQEMLWRAGRLLNENCSRVVGGTFHGIANMLLRRYGSHIGYGSSFSIIDRADAEGIVNLLKSSLGLGKLDKRFPSKRAVINMISGSVNRSIDLEGLVQDQYAHLSDHLEDILALAKAYHQFKFDHGLMDYDDLLVNWKRLLVEAPEVQQAVSERFAYIMVDEYQDTNLIQADIIRLAAHTHDNVMVVGDDSQSIYSFRGADFYNIMRFPKVFAGAKIIKLEENYRSTQPILSLTNDIIRNAAEKYTKTLFTSIEGDLRPMVFAARDERDEAAFIVRTIQQLLRKGVELSDIAVLFRSSFHSYKLELELGSDNLEYEKRGGLKLTESAHMKDMIAFLRVLVNPQDTLSWNRILLQLEKVGPATAQKISANIAGASDALEALKSYVPGKTWKDSYARLVRLFVELHGGNASPAALFEIALDYYQPVFERLYSDDFPKRQKDLDQLKSIMGGYEDLQSFIDDTTLDPPEESSRDGRGADRLILSTIHSSKGLEFEAVFIIGVADGRFPHASATFGEQWEEERRLLYVAATRAKKYLYLTYPRQMMTPDRQFRRVGMSPFLTELSGGLFEHINEQYGESGASFNFQSTAFSAPAGKKKSQVKKLEMTDFSMGCRVKHPFFGDGTVTKLSKSRSLDIHFDRHGLKTLHLDYAKLTIL